MQLVDQKRRVEIGIAGRDTALVHAARFGAHQVARDLVQVLGGAVAARRGIIEVKQFNGQS